VRVIFTAHYKSGHWERPRPFLIIYYRPCIAYRTHIYIVSGLVLLSVLKFLIHCKRKSVQVGAKIILSCTNAKG
jgi:hypothetical protein